MEEIKIDELINKSESDKDIISFLKTGREVPLPDIQSKKDEYYPKQHKIFDRNYLPDREVNTGVTDSAGNPIMKTQKVNRLAFPFQQQIVSKAVSFCFGSPVTLNYEVENDKESVVINAISRIDSDNKITSVNRIVGKEMYRATEVAEVWYMLPINKSKPDLKHDRYGFSTKWKVRVDVFKPWDGNELYPFFDHTGDMVAFSRLYKRKDAKSKDVSFFETFTDQFIYRWTEKAGIWEKSTPIKNEVGKIPVVFGNQEESEWQSASWSIDRIEYLLSKFAETNDYHSAPKIFITGKIKSFVEKGESGGLIEGADGSKAEYLSWTHAPEAVKLEIETLLRFIYSFTQTPDVSFDSVKGLQEISGEALKMLFMDAHLKVQEKREIWDDYLQRRVNIQKAIIGTLNSDLKPVCDNFDITPELTPYTINDETSLINNLITANGGKAILSQKKSIEILGWAKDAKEELAQIELESLGDVYEPTR